MSTSADTNEKVSAGNDHLIPLTEESDNDWSLHIRDSSFVVSFSRVTRMDSGGLHCWSDGIVTVFVSEDEEDLVPKEITEKLIQIAEEN